jgi:ubiquinol-cytochrome c reductase cytochrome b subunit
MASTSRSVSKRGRLFAWFDRRLPIQAFLDRELTGYYAPRNLSVWYYFGALALILLVMQFASGIFLASFYKPGEATAFDSVEYIVREVKWGWFIRYAHSTGASFFFIVVYLHMFRALLYGSYKAPRELLWTIGMLIYLGLMTEAFMGYVLPWGNMSLWGAQVIVNLFGTIPGVGPELVQWIRGDYGISDAALNRFFALHVIAIPLGLLLLVVLHIVALHHVGSSNPDGIEIKEKVDSQGRPLDGIPFHPYYTVKDVLSVGVFLVVFAFVLFFAPTFGGIFLEAANFEPANPVSTPEHIAPGGI